MKNKTSINRQTAIKIMACNLLLAVVLSGCDTAVDQVEKCKKPATVYAKHLSRAWYDSDDMIVKDANGKLITLSKDDLGGLIDKYNVGDTIK